MNELEDFIVELNLIEKDTTHQNESDKAQKLAKYLLDPGTGWKTLLDLYTCKLDVNSIFGEKLNNLLLNTCTKLLLHLPCDPSSSLVDHNDTVIINDRLFSEQMDRTTQLTGNLFNFLVVCLAIYLRFNSGAYNSNILFTTNPILSQLTQTLFNGKHNNDDDDRLQLVYFKFLSQLVRVNFENLRNKKASASVGRLSNMTAGKQQSARSSQHLVMELFNLLKGRVNKSRRSTACLLGLVVDYMYDYLIYTSETISDLSSFDCLVGMLELTSDFIFENLFVDSARWPAVMKKLHTLLAQMRALKNNHEHALNCLRPKHTSQWCKHDLVEIASRHNEITGVKSRCVFAKVNKFSLRLVATLNDKPGEHDKRHRLLGLIEEFGLCTCLDVNDLIDTQILPKSVINEESTTKYYFNNRLSMIIFDYLFLLIDKPNDLATSTTTTPTANNESDQTTDAVKHSSAHTSTTQKRSIFFPLLIDQSLIGPTRMAASDEQYNRHLIKTFGQLILKFDAKAELVCKYLAHSLKRAAKYLKSNANTDTERQHFINSSHSLKYKWLIYEIFYLFREILKSLSVSSSSDSVDNNDAKRSIFEHICRYVSDMLLLLNSHSIYLTDVEPSDENSREQSIQHSTSARRPLKSSQSVYESIGRSGQQLGKKLTHNEFETKINRKFFDHLNKYAVKIHDYVCVLVDRFELGVHLPMVICSQFILFKNNHVETIEQLHNQSASSSSLSWMNVELVLCKAVVEKLEKSDQLLLKNHSVVLILLELYINCSLFRNLLNEWQGFHACLVSCLNGFFQSKEPTPVRHSDQGTASGELERQSSTSNSVDNQHELKYLEILLDLILAYFHYNRKKDLNDIYTLMRNQLNRNVNLLIIYFRVMILSKAFKFKSSFHLDVLNAKNSLVMEDDKLEECDQTNTDSLDLISDRSLELNENDNQNENKNSIDNDSNSTADNKRSRSRSSSYQTTRDSSSPTAVPKSTANDVTNQKPGNESDADESDIDNGQLTNSGDHKCDIILFPKILEICLNYIIYVKQQQYIDLKEACVKSKEEVDKFEHRYDKFNRIALNFLKRLEYVLESCTYNIQIITNNNYHVQLKNLLSQRPNYTLDIIAHTNSFLKQDEQFTEQCFQILFHVCKFDMDEHFLEQLFSYLIDQSHLSYDVTATIQLNKRKMLQLLSMKEMSANLLSKLAESLDPVHSTYYTRSPNQPHQEPIDYLLQTTTGSKKWKINLNYEPTSPNDHSTEKRPSLTDIHSRSGGSDLQVQNKILRESYHNVHAIKVPFKSASSLCQTPANMAQSNGAAGGAQQPAEPTRHSYSLSFMFRFDDNLIKFSRSNCLNHKVGLKSSIFESYIHVISVNLDNEWSSFEIWLNPNGNLIFIRRSEQTILMTFNLMQIKANSWHFIHVNYEEEKAKNKLNCKINYSVNASELLEKDFDIYTSPEKIPGAKSQQQQQQQQPSQQSAQQNLYMYIGYQDKKPEQYQLLSYDLGQIILGREANYTMEHLVLLMQIMDSNLSLIEDTIDYDWTFMNGHLNVSTIENVQIKKNFLDYCAHIKSRTIALYNPRYPHMCGVKYVHNSPLSFVEVTSNCKVIQQTTFDIVLAKLGGIEQFLILLARLVEQENKIFTKMNTQPWPLGDEQETNSRLVNDPNTIERLASLKVLETLLNLINKRPNIQNEFKKLEGYMLMQQVYKAIAGLNKFMMISQPEGSHKQTINYYSTIQRKLFVTLLNGCFRKSVFTMNYHTPNEVNIELCFNPSSFAKKNTPAPLTTSTWPECFVINIDLLANVILEWELWIPFEYLIKLSTSFSARVYVNTHGNNLWKYLFQIVHKMLEDDRSNQLYHTSLFLNANLHQKLIQFVLDANGEHFLIDEASCNWFMRIFTYFKCLFKSDLFKKLNLTTFADKQLFFSFGDYLHILHADNNVYIVNQKSEFYFNFNINSIVNSHKISKSRHSLNKRKLSKDNSKDIVDEAKIAQSPQISTTETKTSEVNMSQTENATTTTTTTTATEEKGQIPTERSVNETIPSLKAQIISFDRINQNEKNFSLIATGLMRVMRDMLPKLPDSLINEIINTFKFESFIMLAMDDHLEKRLEAFKLFLELVERSSTMTFMFKSVAYAAGNVVANMATNPVLIASQSTYTKPFDQQNKEMLIFAMANQLFKYDHVDERFIEFCITKLLNQEFSFKRKLPDNQELKAQAAYILSRQTYLYILIALIYSSRKNVNLCRLTLIFLTQLVECEIVLIDFLVSRAGLLQMLLNLLIYFSDSTVLANILNENQSGAKSGPQDNNDAEFPIVTTITDLLSLVGRLLMRLNENHEIELFGYFVNAMVKLCYESANNSEYEKLNHNIKSIVLNIIQMTMNALYSVSVIQEAPKTSVFLKKLISPLMYMKSDASANVAAASSANNLSNIVVFECDSIFQRFIVFMVDFIHIVYDRILDGPASSLAYEINDELALFALAILVHTMSMALENNQKVKYTYLYRNNLSLMRVQFRRLFLFVMHPNHKIATRLQAIKHLLNTFNCESIVKSMLSLSDNVGGGAQQSSVSFNGKLSFYLSSLFSLCFSSKDSNNTSGSPSTNINAGQLLNNSDREIIVQFNIILLNLGYSYRSELTAVLNTFSKLNGEASDLIVTNLYSDSAYVLVSSAPVASPSTPLSAAQRKNQQCVNDLTTQLEKELDDEIIKIYNKSKVSFAYFLDQCDKLMGELCQFSRILTNQVVVYHSNVRRTYLHGLKNKLIKSFDIKEKWMELIENMTHEKCLWHDANSSPGFYILDQTEGPNRERRRTKKSHLYIAERFFKDDVKCKLTNEKNAHPLRYLLNSFEDYLSNSKNFSADRSSVEAESESNTFENDSDNFFISNYANIHWRTNEIISHYECKNVMPYCEIKGQLFMTETHINFAADERNYKYLMGIENVSYCWSYNDIREVHFRRYLLKDVGLEIFLVFGHTILLAFEDTKERNDSYKVLANRRPANLIRTESIDDITNLWKESKISNYEYLMQLNKFSGRTFNDLMQYPVYPHILSNYTSDTIDLAAPENYRDLSKPIAIQHKEREEKFLQNYRMLLESSNEAYHYASLYSNSGTVLHYLVRLPPFTKMFLDYQDQNFDVPDRTFHSMKTSWLLSSSDSTTDYKELIPEFYFLHEFLTNTQGFNFGLRQNGDPIDNVVLPPWCKANPRIFIIIMRQALESNHVTANLNNWIDLIFGYKQSGRNALDAINCYHPACYFGYPVEQISDKVHRKAIETMIKTWGQTPKQLFTTSHPQSQINNQMRKSSSLQSIQPVINNALLELSKDSIHHLVLNAKWGNYVGSLDQPSAPVCVWKEPCKKNIVSFVSLPTNDVIALSQHKCMLLERPTSSSLRFSTGGAGTGGNATGSGGSNSTDYPYMALIEWNSFDDYINVKYDGDKQSYPLVPIRSNENTVVCCSCIGLNYLVVGFRSGLIKVYKLKKNNKTMQIHHKSFICHLYGHKQEITDIYVCLSYSTMLTASQEGLVIVWDTNKFKYVNSIVLRNQPIYKVSICETTNDIAFISNNPNRLNFYTGNCELIGEREAWQDNERVGSGGGEFNDNLFMKSLCFSNATEGLNVNVIAVGMSNGKIRLYSTWDLTFLREISINVDAGTLIGSIISLTYTKDGKRLYVSDTYARVYILEAANSPTVLAKNSQLQLLSSLNTLNTINTTNLNATNYSSNLICYT